MARDAAPMQWQFQPMNARHARSIAAWRYEPPYDFYNPGEDIGDLLRPEYQYYAVTAGDGELAGYCCFGADARVPGGDYADDVPLDVGVGLRPDLTGKGLGEAFLGAVLDFGERTFAPAAFRTTVAAFNQRSRRLCERAGFRPVQRFVCAGDGVEFEVLVRAAG
jgi:RimJ/RimL family protein N-acetyltransferase